MHRNAIFIESLRRDTNVTGVFDVRGPFHTEFTKRSYYHIGGVKRLKGFRVVGRYKVFV